MLFTISREYHFSAGHRLPQVQSPHPCAKQHGHSYSLRVRMMARDVDSDGFVRDDCSKIDNAIAKLEGTDLCEMIAAEYTTPECLATILFTVFRKFYPEVCKVSVSDRPERSIAYEGPMPPQWARQQATAMIATLQLDEIKRPNEIVMP